VPILSSLFSEAVGALQDSPIYSDRGGVSDDGDGEVAEVSDEGDGIEGDQAVNQLLAKSLYKNEPLLLFYCYPATDLSLGQ
jgi:hypothetical protein